MMNETKAAKLEAAIRELTRPINGQYPRPWTISPKDPAASRVFVVGTKPAYPFLEKCIGSHDRYLGALFNRGPETCRQLLDRVASGSLPTRKKIDDLVRRLEEHGVTDVLDTNVICYSTHESRGDPKDSPHTDGADRGRKIFTTLFNIIEPKGLIVYGVGAVKMLSKVLSHDFPRPPTRLPSEPVEAVFAQTWVLVIPSLDPRVVNPLGPSLVNKHHEDVCRAVAAYLK